MPMAFADERTRIVLGPHQRQHRHVPGAPVGQAGQLLDQQRVVGQVGFLAAMHLGVARRIHAGRACSGTHRPESSARAGSPSGGWRGGLASAFSMKVTRLFGSGTPSSPWGTSPAGEQGGKLTQLAGIVGRQHHAAQRFGNLGEVMAAFGSRPPPPCPPGVPCRCCASAGRMMNMAIAQQDRHILLSLWIILSLIVSDAPAMNSSRFARRLRPAPFHSGRVWSRQSGRHLARTPPATPLPTRHRPGPKPHLRP